MQRYQASELKITIRKKLIFLALVLFTGNGLIGLAVYNCNEKLQQTKSLEEHSERVLDQTAYVQSLGKEIQFISRSFVITNEPIYLDQLAKANTLRIGSIEKLKELTEGNADQRILADSLSYYMQKRMEFSFKTVGVRGREGLEPAIALISTKTGSRYSAQIERIAKMLRDQESKVLNGRKKESAASMREFNRFATAMFVLMLTFTLLLLLTFGNILLQKKQRERQAQELYQTNQELIETKEALNEHIEGLEEIMFMTSHQVRRPITNILGFSNVLDDVLQSPAELKQTVNYIKESAITLDKFTKELISFMTRMRVGCSVGSPK